LQLNRNRFYHQQLGRWVNRDPVGYEDGNNLYQFELSSPVQNIDPQGTITIKGVGRFKKNPGCEGPAARRWRLSLSGPASCDGYIVQEVHVSCSVGTCKVTGKCGKACEIDSREEYRYYEAWYVKKGDVVSKTDNKSIDRAHWSPFQPCGSYRQHGSVRFYCKNPADSPLNIGTGNLTSWGRGRNHGTVCKTFAGGLKSTGSRPGFWNSLPSAEAGSPFLNQAFRVLQSNWCCCQTCSNRFHRASASP